MNIIKWIDFEQTYDYRKLRSLDEITSKNGLFALFFTYQVRNRRGVDFYASFELF